MLKRTAKKFWTERAGRMYRHAEALERAPLAFGETTEQRNAAAKELRDDADRDVERRRTMQRERRNVQGQARRGISVPRQQTGRAQNARERVASLAAVKRAHQPPQLTPKAAKKLLTKRRRVASVRNLEFLGFMASVPRA